jgi:hypothetical protein
MSIVSRFSLFVLNFNTLDAYDDSSRFGDHKFPVSTPVSDADLQDRSKFPQRRLREEEPGGG